MSWFSTGMDEVKKEQERREQSGGKKEFNRHDIFRFYISTKELNKEKRLIFLDEVGFNVNMHQYEHNGTWGNWATCPKATGVSSWCPLCNRPKSWASQFTHYTVIDATGWTDKDNKEHYSIRILPAKPKTALKIDNRREKHGTLIGADFTFIRTTKDADNCGDDIIYEGRVNLDEFLAQNLDKLKGTLDWYPKDYGFWTGEGDQRKYNINHGLPFEKVLAPMTAEELQQMLTNSGGVASGDVGQPSDNPSY